MTLQVAVVGRAAGLVQRDALFLPDDFPGEGPLAALATALARAEDTLLVVPCDLPRLSVEALAWLGAQETGAFGVVATTPDGKHQPLFARYTPALLPVLQQSLAAGERSFKPLLTAGLLRFVAVPAELAPHLESANDPPSWQRLTSPSPSSCP